MWHTYHRICLASHVNFEIKCANMCDWVMLQLSRLFQIPSTRIECIWNRIYTSAFRIYVQERVKAWIWINYISPALNYVHHRWLLVKYKSLSAIIVSWQYVYSKFLLPVSTWIYDHVSDRAPYLGEVCMNFKYWKRNVTKYKWFIFGYISLLRNYYFT